MFLDMLYKKTTTGAIQTWVMEVQGAKYRVISGQRDGKKVESAWTEAKAKNVGRSNATTANEQAIAEALAEWEKKQRDGYHTSEESALASGKKTPSKAFQCMLAENYNDESRRLEAHRALARKALFSQPKLDGVRLLVTAGEMMSRKNRPIVSAPHILQALRGFFAKHPDAILDGELYADTLSDNFNQIISLAKKQKPSAGDLKESAKFLEYHVYDVAHLSDTRYEERYKFLQEQLSGIAMVKVVRLNLIETVEDIQKFHDEYTEAGYEGQILRLNGVYENKRSAYLLKHKEHVDAEFKVLDIEEGIGNAAGLAAKVWIELPNGNKCKANIKGDRKYRAELLRDKAKYIGGEVTVRYNNITPDGALRFGRAIAGKWYPGGRTL